MSSPGADPKGPARILVVDDEPDVCELLGEFLSSEGYEVSTAASGDAAVVRAGTETFDLVITDLRMPGISGVDTVAALKRIDPRMAVIVVSGHVSEESATRCRQEGATRIVHKPFEIEDLLHFVELALRDRRHADPGTNGVLGGGHVNRS